MKRNRLINITEYTLLRILLCLLRLLPYSAGKKVVTSLFYLVGYLGGVRREVAHRQISKVYPQLSPKEAKKLLRKLYHNMGMTVAEIYLLPNKELLACCKISGKEYAEQALAFGKGAILATAHYGNWEAARVLPEFGIPLSVVVKKQHNELFDRFNNAIRSQHGVGIIDFRSGLRDIISTLRKNEMVAILADQNAGHRGHILDFLGFPASHHIGVAKLSLHYKVPIVPGFAVRKPDGTINFCFEPPIYHPDWEDNEQNYLRLLSEVNSVIERYIHKHPEQWFWVHKRWKATKAMD